ncbi:MULTISPECIES: helix-turn-helix domain-containing protein [Streptosporangium]|uniref:Transcriptional regulator GlxA family with amidase domain n=1 Tax=Streptosporangium brasiliense TaxID=47480 RepID=A0ABT9REV5_9ACTN|nr:helix-turn-helix domain-containing protein [Streptosporangium brasiliense]MDP9867808.1 transcriptional regulator GlxA family with amidase domain [Streptosporangium brasiliense]
MHTIALATAGHLLHFELAVAYEIFGTPPGEATGDWYEVLLCGPGPVRIGPFTVEPDHGLERLTGADTVIVPACADIDDPPPPELLEAVRAAHESGARVASLCTGAFALGAAGLLDGRRATTHWAHAAELSARHPRAVVDPDVLYTDNGSVLTAAGKAAAVDLCIHLIHLDHGAAVANSVARRLVMPPHRPGGQAQFVATPMQVTGDHVLVGLLAWVRQRLDQPLTVTDMARKANMSPRNLGRQFQAVTGQTPIQWLLAQRVRRAQELLEATDESIEAVALAAGMGTATTLRRQFKRIVGVPPDSYRRSFRGARPA